MRCDATEEQGSGWRVAPADRSVVRVSRITRDRAQIATLEGRADAAAVNARQWW